MDSSQTIIIFNISSVLRLELTICLCTFNFFYIKLFFSSIFDEIVKIEWTMGNSQILIFTKSISDMNHN
jgi:hypothetical protein